MPSAFWPLIVIYMVFGGILVAAIVSFVRTPSKERYTLVAPKKRHNHKLQAQLASGEAVEIAPQPRLAFLRAMPWVLLMTPYLAFMLYLQQLLNIQCAELFGLPVAYLNLLMLFYGAIFLFLPLTLFSLLPLGLKVLRHGYFPPLDSAVFVRTIARRGTITQLRGALALCMSLALPLFVVYGHLSYIEFTKGHSQTEIIQIFREACIRK